MEWKEAGIMKQKVSDYIADYIAEWGIRDVFTVTGGGAMHMNDAFGHHPKLHCTYQHHEQACAIRPKHTANLMISVPAMPTSHQARTCSQMEHPRAALQPKKQHSL